MNGFICAEVMAYADFKEHGSESAVKAAGKYRQEGKNYTVVDGDIMFFKVCRHLPLPSSSLRFFGKKTTALLIAIPFRLLLQANTGGGLGKKK